jgi:acetolactate synthase I/III small subunit
MTSNGSIKKHTISCYVSNKPGVMIRIALVFSRRGFNIDSFIGSESNVPGFSNINIVATGDEETLDQILKQLNKLVDVVHARDRTGEDIIQRELCLIKLKCEQNDRTDIIQASQALGCDVVDLWESSIILQVAGRSEKIENVVKMFETYGIIEMVRTGKILMARGEEITS